MPKVGRNRGRHQPRCVHAHAQARQPRNFGVGGRRKPRIFQEVVARGSPVRVRRRRGQGGNKICGALRVPARSVKLVAKRCRVEAEVKVSVHHADGFVAAQHEGRRVRLAVQHGPINAPPARHVKVGRPAVRHQRHRGEAHEGAGHGERRGVVEQPAHGHAHHAQRGGGRRGLRAHKVDRGALQAALQLSHVQLVAGQHAAGGVHGQRGTQGKVARGAAAILVEPQGAVRGTGHGDAVAEAQHQQRGAIRGERRAAGEGGDKERKRHPKHCWKNLHLLLINNLN